MTSRTWVSCSIACFTLLAVTLPAQDNPAPTPAGTMDVTGIPGPRGIYYHASNQWVALSPNVLMPFAAGRPLALEILNVGSDHTITEMPGSRAGVQIGNDARPTFYLHGISPSELYLVRAIRKPDYRELRMPISRQFREWAHFEAKDVTDFEIQAVNGDIVAIKPSADLKPGEYALASAFESGAQWLRIGFDFGIVGPGTGQ